MELYDRLLINVGILRIGLNFKPVSILRQQFSFTSPLHWDVHRILLRGSRSYSALSDILPVGPQEVR